MIRKVARSLVAGAGAAGALALLNRELAAGLPINHVPGSPRRWSWRGHELFAVESGAGPAIVLLHAPGLCGSSYEYRKLFPLLARRRRVIAFDFLGCGLSDMPRTEYSAELFIEQILAALDEFCPQGAILVGSSLAAAYAIRAAARNAGRVQGLVAIGLATAGGASLPAPWALQLPIVGESYFNALVSRRSLRRLLTSAMYADASHLTPDVMNVYYAVAHQPGSRYVGTAFVDGRLDCEVAQDLPFVEAPLLILWGKRSTANPARNAVEYAALAKTSEVEYFVRSAALPHDEEAEAVAARIERFAG